MAELNEGVPPRVVQRLAEGHNVEPDPTHPLSSANRWTCSRCGNAVLEVGSNIYGSATIQSCKAARLEWSS